MEQKINATTSSLFNNKWGIWSVFSTNYHGFAVEHRTTDKDDVDVRGFEEPCIVVVKYNDKDKIFLLYTYAIHDRETGEIKYDHIPDNIKEVDKEEVTSTVLGYMISYGTTINQELVTDISNLVTNL